MTMTMQYPDSARVARAIKKVNQGIRDGGMTAAELSEPEAVLTQAGYDEYWIEDLTMTEIGYWLRHVRREAREYESVQARRSRMDLDLDLSGELHTND